jgi:hypothetical protein
MVPSISYYEIIWSYGIHPLFRVARCELRGEYPTKQKSALPNLISEIEII